MSLIEQIQYDRQAARVAKDELRAMILTVAVGEVERLRGKEAITDERVIAIIKKMIEDNKQVVQVTGNDVIRRNALLEIAILEAYLPQQLTAGDVAYIIVSNDFTSIKELMAFMKTNYAGRYDGKMVSQLFNK